MRNEKSKKFDDEIETDEKEKFLPKEGSKRACINDNKKDPQGREKRKKEKSRVSLPDVKLDCHAVNINKNCAEVCLTIFRIPQSSRP